MRWLLLIALLLLPTPSWAENWYVDNAASGTNAGTSWTNAWQSIATINYASVNPGDTIYISGGTTSQIYDEVFALPKSGTAGSVITISTGQDAGHNGTVIMTCAGGSGQWLADGNLSYVHITGNVGGAQHLRINCVGWTWNVATTRTISHVHLSYLNFPAMRYGFYLQNGSMQDAIEIEHSTFDHVYWASRSISDFHADLVFYNLGGLSLNAPYDTVLIHHNTINLPMNGALGDDGVKWGAGISFYNNIVTAVYDATYADDQHSDVFQINTGQFKIYNNTFINVGESIVFFDVESGVNGYTGLKIYNNLFVNARSPSGVSRGMDLFVKAPAAGSTFTDFIVVSNTFVDWTTGAFAVRISGAASCTNCVIKNNLFKDSGGLSSLFALQGGVTSSNNSIANSATQFVNYTQYAAATNDLHLAASDTASIDQGADLSALIPLLDYDGITRPQGATWDLGAYEYGSAPIPVKITGLHAATFTGSTWTFLIWNPSLDTGLSGYYVYRCIASGTCINRIATITFASAAAAYNPATQWYDSKLYASGTYYYTIAAFNGSNVAGPISGELSVTVTGKQ